MTTLSEREIALSTSGLSTLADTTGTTERLGRIVHLTYPEPGDAPAWRAVRERSALSTSTVDDPRLVETDIHGVPCCTIRVEGALGTYLHLHGGGWAFGSHRSQDARLLALADATGLSVVSVGYRLAPEHTLHDAIADCVTVARSLDTTEGPLAIGGESAGAHLASATLLRLRDEGRTPFAAAVLSYGVYDLAGTPGRLAAEAPTVATLAENVLPGSAVADLRSPDVSPLYADLSGLPPARFMCGTRDPLLDDTLLMEARWRQVAETETDVVAGAIHAFTLDTDSRTTTAAREAEHTFLRRRIARVRGSLG